MARRVKTDDVSGRTHTRIEMKRLLSLTLVMTPLFVIALAAQTKPAPSSAEKPAAKGGVRTVDIAGTDQMKYDVETITAKRGEQLRVRLTVKGTMPKVVMAHNFVLLKLTANPVKFITAGAQSRQTDFIAPEMKDQVLAATALAGAGETVEVTIKVPNAAGSYPFLCTFPGHFQAGMKGNLVVK
jgi:azurin